VSNGVTKEPPSWPGKRFCPSGESTDGSGRPLFSRSDLRLFSWNSGLLFFKCSITLATMSSDNLFVSNFPPSVRGSVCLRPTFILSCNDESSNNRSDFTSELKPSTKLFCFSLLIISTKSDMLVTWSSLELMRGSLIIASNSLSDKISECCT